MKKALLDIQNILMGKDLKFEASQWTIPCPHWIQKQQAIAKNF